MLDHVAGFDQILAGSADSDGAVSEKRQRPVNVVVGDDPLP